MILRLLPLAVLLAASGVAAQQTTDPSQLFGVRESVEHIDIWGM
jgi:hypothetical protein